MDDWPLTATEFSGLRKHQNNPACLKNKKHQTFTVVRNKCVFPHLHALQHAGNIGEGLRGAKVLVCLLQELLIPVELRQPQLTVPHPAVVLAQVKLLPRPLQQLHHLPQQQTRCWLPPSCLLQQSCHLPQLLTLFWLTLLCSFQQSHNLPQSSMLFWLTLLCSFQQSHNLPQSSMLFWLTLLCSFQQSHNLPQSSILF